MRVFPQPLKPRQGSTTMARVSVGPDAPTLIRRRLDIRTGLINGFGKGTASSRAVRAENKSGLLAPEVRWLCPPQTFVRRILVLKDDDVSACARSALTCCRLTPHVLQHRLPRLSIKQSQGAL